MGITNSKETTIDDFHTIVQRIQKHHGSIDRSVFVYLHLAYHIYIDKLHKEYFYRIEYKHLDLQNTQDKLEAEALLRLSSDKDIQKLFRDTYHTLISQAFSLFGQIPGEHIPFLIRSSDRFTFQSKLDISQVLTTVPPQEIYNTKSKRRMKDHPILCLKSNKQHQKEFRSHLLPDPLRGHGTYIRDLLLGYLSHMIGYNHDKTHEGLYLIPNGMFDEHNDNLITKIFFNQYFVTLDFCISFLYYILLGVYQKYLPPSEDINEVIFARYLIYRLETEKVPLDLQYPSQFTVPDSNPISALKYLQSTGKILKTQYEVLNWYQTTLATDRFKDP